jgi:hypothetical protein
VKVAGWPGCRSKAATKRSSRYSAFDRLDLPLQPVERADGARIDELRIVDLEPGRQPVDQSTRACRAAGSVTFRTVTSRSFCRTAASTLVPSSL